MFSQFVGKWSSRQLKMSIQMKMLLLLELPGNNEPYCTSFRFAFYLRSLKDASEMVIRS